MFVDWAPTAQCSNVNTVTNSAYIMQNSPRGDTALSFLEINNASQLSRLSAPITGVLGE